MPGLFGAVGCSHEVLERLAACFSAPWQECETVRLPGGILGGHAFQPGRALHQAGDGVQFAVDGERSLYARAGHLAALVRWEGEVPVPTPLCKGNLAIADGERGLWLVLTEWSGSFPLYYHHAANELIFCSRLGPIAEATGAQPDPVGVAQFLRSADSLAGRTPFRDVRRLQPGQVLVYRPECDQLRVHETSRAWASEESSLAVRGAAADQAWQALQAGVERSLDADERAGLMISGGWDSRTLLAAVRQRVEASKVVCYAHGDLHSRELRLVEGIAGELGTRVRVEGIDDRAYEVESLQRSFGRVENIVFPHWHRAGAMLAGEETRCVTAGVFGEVLGGHYGRAMVLAGGRKMAAVGAALLGLEPAGPGDVASAVPAVRDLFRVRDAAKPWHVKAEFWHSDPGLVDALNADMEADVQRLAARVGNLDQLIEAFITEHRGSQYITAQILSCRSSVDIALPFADQEVLVLAGRIPLRAKIHNSLNREMLRRYRPGLLRYGLAATLLPASAPMLAQEASRLVRRVWEDTGWWLHRVFPGLAAPPRLGWVDFEFLRSGRALNALADDMKCDFWDGTAIRRAIANLGSGNRRQSAHPLSDMMMKIYTLDLLLRPRRRG